MAWELSPGRTIRGAYTGPLTANPTSPPDCFRHKGWIVAPSFFVGALAASNSQGTFFLPINNVTDWKFTIGVTSVTGTGQMVLVMNSLGPNVPGASAKNFFTRALTAVAGAQTIAVGGTMGWDGTRDALQGDATATTGYPWGPLYNVTWTRDIDMTCNVDISGVFIDRSIA